MKKITLLLVTMLVSITSTQATEYVAKKTSKDLSINKRYRFTQPVMFVERGVEFLIFSNGEFDFNTDIHYGYDDYYYRRGNTKRGSINATVGAPGVRINYTRPRGVYVAHDRFGRVRRVGNVFINYDHQGRIKRVGSVYIRYRHGRLKQVGGLHLQYNRRGKLISTWGKVNRSNQGCSLCGITDCTTDHFNNGNYNDWHQDDWYDEDDYYYYRKGDKNLKKQKRKKHK